MPHPAVPLAADCAASAVTLSRVPFVSGFLGSDLRDLGDWAYRRLFAACVEPDMPLLIHPSSTGGVDGDDDRRLGHRSGRMLFGYANEDPLAVSSVVFGDALERRPSLDVGVSHRRRVVPFLTGRLKHRARAWATGAASAAASIHGLRRPWLDVQLHGEQALAGNNTRLQRRDR